MAIKYCPSCKRNVNTEHSWHIGVMLILLLLGIIPGLIYIAVKWKYRCPICKTPDSMLLAPKFDDGPGQAPQHPYP